MVTFLYRLLTIQRTGGSGTVGNKKEGKQLPRKRKKVVTPSVTSHCSSGAEEKKKTIGRFATFLVKLFFWKGPISID
jgi:hypothetical protein